MNGAYGLPSLFYRYPQSPALIVQVVDCKVIRTRYHSQCGSYVVQVGAVNVLREHRLKKPQLYTYKRLGLTPKKKLIEFKVSPEAVLPTGVKLGAAHFVPGQFVDCQAKTYILLKNVKLIHQGGQGFPRCHEEMGI